MIRKEEYSALFRNQQQSMETFVNEPVEEEPKPVVKKSESVKVSPSTPVVAPQPKPTTQTAGTGKANVDVSGIVPGTTVVHAAFGEGIVQKIDAHQKYIYIKFGTNTKMFIFPDVFIKIPPTKQEPLLKVK